MGSLNRAELLAAIEDEFGIRIDGLEAAEILAVGQLYACVLAKLRAERGGLCLSSRVFYRLRRALVSELGRSRRSITPESRLEALVPRRGRRRHWRRLASASGLRLPDLHPSVWVELSFFALILGATLLAAWLSSAGGASQSSRHLVLLGVMAVPLVFLQFPRAKYAIVTCWRAVIPSDYATVRDAVHSLVALNYRQLAAEERPPDAADVRATLHRLVATYATVASCGEVKPDEVNESSRLSDDLWL